MQCFNLSFVTSTLWSASCGFCGREFFFDHFTAADAHFFWCMRRATQFGLDFAPYKNCSAHFARMTNRPSVQKLLAFEKSVQEQFAKAA